ncbi:MAG: hypothetical protein HC848_09480 [Limnobacter sp.]|nr:hypothetical protein [Limnobacter sp.]
MLKIQGIRFLLVRGSSYNPIIACPARPMRCASASFSEKKKRRLGLLPALDGSEDKQAKARGTLPAYGKSKDSVPDGLFKVPSGLGKRKTYSARPVTYVFPAKHAGM